MGRNSGIVADIRKAPWRDCRVAEPGRCNRPSTAPPPPMPALSAGNRLGVTLPSFQANHGPRRHRPPGAARCMIPCAIPSDRLGCVPSRAPP